MASGVQMVIDELSTSNTLLDWRGDVVIIKSSC